MRKYVPTSLLLGQDFDVLCSVNDAKIFWPQKRSPWPSILLKVGGYDGDYGNMGCQVPKRGIQKLDPFLIFGQKMSYSKKAILFYD